MIFKHILDKKVNKCKIIKHKKKKIKTLKVIINF